MQLSVLKDKYHPRSPWLVVLPARLSPTGKRQYKRFAARSAAMDYIASVRAEVRRNGEKPMAMLPAAVAADAAAAAALLEGTGLSLCDAVRQLLSVLHGTGVASAQYIPSRGTGNENTATPKTAPRRSDLTLNAICEHVDRVKKHQRQSTIRQRHFTVAALIRAVPELKHTPIEALSTPQWQHIFDSVWKHSPQCFNSGRRIIHALYSFAIRRQLIPPHNPITAIDFQYVKEAEINALPPAELCALFAAARPTNSTDEKLSTTCKKVKRALKADLTYLRPYIALCAFAGIRPTECARLTWQDVDMEDGVISVRHASSKTGGQRHIQMHPTLRAWLETYRPPDAAPTDKITDNKNLAIRLTALHARAGFNADHPWQNDVLRHSYATYYLKNQCGDLTQLQLNMGHRSAMLLYTRYTNMAGVTRDMAANWWTITPSTCPL